MANVSIALLNLVRKVYSDISRFADISLKFVKIVRGPFCIRIFSNIRENVIKKVLFITFIESSCNFLFSLLDPEVKAACSICTVEVPITILNEHEEKCKKP